jgi:signal peptidase I
LRRADIQAILKNNERFDALSGESSDRSRAHMKKISTASLFRIVSTAFLIVVGLVIILKLFFIESRVVVSDSMAPTLIEGDRLICIRLGFSVKTGSPAIRAALKATDIIVLKLDTDADFLIKRIVGLPGDVVELRINGVFINGERLAEEYLASDWESASYARYLIPNNGVFVLGDHRALSRDSRVFGIVRADEIREKVLFRFYPLGRIGFLR